MMINISSEDVAALERLLSKVSQTKTTPKLKNPLQTKREARISNIEHFLMKSSRKK